MAIQMGCTIYDLEESELCYAPRTEAQKTRQLRGNGRGEYPPRRHAALSTGTRSTARSFSMCGILRNWRWSRSGCGQYPVAATPLRLGELPRDREILVICRSGGRAYFATRLLMQNGFKARNISGGMLSRSHATSSGTKT